MSENSPKTVFVVDDEPIIASTLSTILNSSSFRATAFTSTEEAIEAAELRCPDLLITDVSMPGMNGIELAARFKSLCPNCKVLLFSGHYATSALLDSARKQGNDFQLLTKPIHPKDLLAAISKM